MGAVPSNTKSTVQARLQSISDNITTETLEVTLQGWSLVKFLDEQCSPSEREQCQIGKGLVYCGTEERAYVTTLSAYVAKQWPCRGKDVLDSIQRLCDTQQPVTSKILTCKVDIQAFSDDTKLEITGRRAEALEIIEVCIFIAMACQLSQDADKPSQCTPLLYGGPDDDSRITVSAIHQSLERPSTTSWLAMVKNPVIAYGYPIPKRPSDTLLGLEIEFSLLALLSGVEYGHSIAGRFALKSHHSCLVPISVTRNCMSWHLCYKLPYVSFEEAFAIESQPSVDAFYSTPELDSGRYRHFVGGQ